ncbi:MAG TPA: FecR family protein [Puia sp.]|nr:FecR family protein [Puia sp.]
MPPNKNRSILRSLIKKYLAGKASASEADFVESYYHQFDGKATGDTLTGDDQQVAEDSMLQRLNARIDQEERAAIVPMYRRPFWRVTAAAAVLLLIVGSYWYSRSRDNIRQLVAQTAYADVVPGGDKAVLTLSNGQTVILDSASDGRVAQQGRSTVVKLANGQLAYEIPAGRHLPGEGGSGEGAVLYNTLATPIGGQYKITLPDGTRAWLNSASSIRYPTSFSGRERRVEITGEAYFEVKDDARAPFVVTTRGIAINVLGTHFNVMAYTEEGPINTTLVEGKVRVSSAKGNVILQPGQKAIAGNVEPAIIVLTADTDKETAWINGFFEFGETDLPTLMRQLQRWYGIQPVYQGKGDGRRFGGRISRSLNLSRVLELLQHNGLNCKLEGNNLIVLP